MVVVVFTILTAVLFLAVIGYATWLYRQGSFPESHLKKNAKRAARLTRRLDREEAEQEPKEHS